MAKKLTAWKTKGMNQDLSVSAFNPEFSFENRNLRLSTNESNTQLSWVNEKGTQLLKPTDGKECWVRGEEEVYIQPSDDDTWTHYPAGKPFAISGITIGTAVINRQLVLFTTDTDNSNDYIYVFEYSGDNLVGRLLYKGHLNFKVNCPIETLVSYESESIQKVYWTDGENQPRLINIVNKTREYKEDGLVDTQFDFIPELRLSEKVEVVKNTGTTGQFAPGVIQYCFTYYKKNGQETNIFYTTPLYYVSHRDRGGSPEEKVDNSFTVTIKDIDLNFDFLRIYSLQRTSINGTPIAKFVQDIDISNPDKLEYVDPKDKLKGKKVSYTDTGLYGTSVDPSELLYKGGEVISAETMSQKDGTLFFGNFGVIRDYITPDLKNKIKNNITLESSVRVIRPTVIIDHVSPNSPEHYYHTIQLNAVVSDFKTTTGKNTGYLTSCGGFKRGDWYRCGVQFQHKTGKWSDPVYIKDIQITSVSEQAVDDTQDQDIEVKDIKLPNIAATLNSNNNEIVQSLKKAGYKKIRPVVVFPSIEDRTTICQGVANPTLYTEDERNEDKTLYAQSSWFFRPRIAWILDENYHPKNVAFPLNTNNSPLPYANHQEWNGFPDSRKVVDARSLKKVEIQGDFYDNHQFKVDRLSMRTLHSPDVEFDEQIKNTDFNNVSLVTVGTVNFQYTQATIDMQMATAAIGNNSAGFTPKEYITSRVDSEDSVTSGADGIISGLFYEDRLVDDEPGDDEEDPYLEPWGGWPTPAKWLVYPWQADGSVNNDINRPAFAGTPTAILKKKVISNYRYSHSTLKSSLDSEKDFYSLQESPQLFYSEETAGLLRFHSLDGDNTSNIMYKGNIDTSLMPDTFDGQYCAHDGDISLDSPVNYKTWSRSETETNQNGLYKWDDASGHWYWASDGFLGDEWVSLCVKRSPVRMKYKSTPHLVVYAKNIDYKDDISEDELVHEDTVDSILPIVEIQQTTSQDTRFGGTSEQALRNNIWLPCGEPVSLDDVKDGNLTFYYDYGDTYYQRYDCLKTYAYTTDDINQVVEIGSFMLESHVNIDGRYDRNRGLVNNLNMSPRNFNLINMVYSQKDNFFSYRIQDEDYYKNKNFPNQITWSKTKTSGADTDMWTNITLASTLELDGDKGEITAIKRFNDQLLCFQDQGISQVLYNENVQISSTDGVPIEIANSGKVQGKRYLSNTIGCSNKWSIATSPMGIYFMDSISKDIYLFNGQFNNLTTAHDMNSWAKEAIPNQDAEWTPENFGNFVSYYDIHNQEVLFIDKDEALAFNEKFQTFTSFYDYGKSPYFCNLDGKGIWVRDGELWQHQAGKYCNFFGTEDTPNYKPYGMTLIANPEPQIDKIFTNFEFRANVDGDGTPDDKDFKFLLPFDYLETWNEYQHGYAELSLRNGTDLYRHHTLDNKASLKRKFRIWRCDIPRDNCLLDIDREGDEAYSRDEDLHISRYLRKSMDRMRNPWLYLKLKKNSIEDMPRVEIHDLVMTYFD